MTHLVNQLTTQEETVYLRVMLTPSHITMHCFQDLQKIVNWFRRRISYHLLTNQLGRPFKPLVNMAFSLLAPLRQSPSCRIWWKHVWVSQKIWAESADNYRNCFTLWDSAALEEHNPQVREDQTSFRLVAALLTLFSMHQFIFKIQLKVKMPIFRV